jgi:plasmid replication initiation protein
MTDQPMTRWDNNSTGFAVQDNELIRSAYSMSLNSKRLFLLALSKINSMNFAGKDTCIGVVISAEEWGNLYGNGESWRALKRATQELMRRQVVIRPMDKKSKKVLNFCDSAEYFEGSGKCHIRFGYTVSIMLSGMLDEFTKIDLLNTAKFTSRNTIRLYELISQMRNRNKDKYWLYISVEELRVCMGFSDKQYARFTDFRRAVIEPSITEINNQSDMKITHVEYKRESKKIIGMRFSFIENDQLPLL